MFKSTKLHNKTVSAQPSIRIGNRVPHNAVNLAYTYAPPLQLTQNVQITDTSSFILENATADRYANIAVYPDDRKKLQTLAGSSIFNSRSFLLTDVFKNSQPLYYAYETKYLIIDSKGPDAYGFYQGSSISLRNSQGEDMHLNYKVRLIPTSQPKRYRAVIYTDFQTQPESDVLVVYNAFSPGMLLSGFIEPLNPQPAYIRAKSLAELTASSALYYRTNGADIGQSEIYVSTLPIHDKDYRSPVSFRYKLTATITGQTIQTPWIADTVLGAASLVSSDGYVNGFKYLRGKTAKDLLADFFTVAELAPYIAAGAGTQYAVLLETPDPSLSIYTQSDGNNYVQISCSANTGTINLPANYARERRIKNIPFTLNISPGMVVAPSGTTTTISGTVNHTEGFKEIYTLLDGETWTSAGAIMFQKGTKIYAMSDLDDLYFLPQYALQLIDSQQIKAVMPAEKQAIENWYVRVKNGRFDRTQLTRTGLQYVYRYLVPEYFRQDFDAVYGIPYRKVIDERPDVVGEQKIKVRHMPLLIKYTGPDINLHVTINGIEAKVKSWDLTNGVIEVDEVIKDYDDIKVSYYYEEDAYTYRGYWNEAQNKFLHLDLNPSLGHVYSDIDPSTGDIIDLPSSNLINKTIYLYIKPAIQFADASMVAAQRMIRGSYKKDVLFHSFTELNATENPTYLLLARIQVRPNSSIDNVITVDTRVRGGGLKDSINKAIMKSINPESEYYWDIGYWDGEPFSENGVIIIRMPKFVLQEYGGQFTGPEIEAIVKRHVGFGNLFLIEYVEAQQQIIAAPQNLHLDII